jgi:rare lipoprotein A
MLENKRVERVRRIALMAAGGSALLLAGCTTSPEPKMALNSSTKEYFSEAAYGVKASPRVAELGERVPRRAGHYQVGDPYKVKGRWYRPKLDTDYKKVGAASWYGSAFNGRLTANGEVYDMTRLTAAHPTMPLPSYARVTNLENGSSVIVRVNDRGPFEYGRIIDLSKRAALLLDYQHTGVANVEVAYVGPAPLEGNDDRYLLASYQPGDGAAPDPSIGLPTGVMVAMNGTTPSSVEGAATVAFAGQPGLITLPASGPIVPDRPEMDEIAGVQPIPLLSYADRRVNAAAGAFAAVLESSMSAQDIIRSWKRTGGDVAARPAEPGYLALGTWHSREAALEEMQALTAIGRPEMEISRSGGKANYSLSLYPDGRYSLDAMLEQAWANGAADAFAVRD